MTAGRVPHALRERYRTTDSVALHDIAQQLASGVIALMEAVIPSVALDHQSAHLGDLRRLNMEVAHLRVGARVETIRFIADWSERARKLERQYDAISAPRAARRRKRNALTAAR